MANQYKDFRTADTLTTMSPYITYSDPDTSPPSPQKLIRDELDPGFSEEWGEDVNRLRAGRGVYICRIQSKNYSVWSAHYSVDKEKSAPVSPVCYHCVWLVWLLVTASPGWKQRILERQRERERETAFLSRSIRDTSFTLYCYIILHVSARS